MKAAAARAGLSPHTVRAWERRYGALKPSRTETNRRVYDEEEVERLCLLGRVVEAGHSISNVAQLSSLELQDLVRSTRSIPDRPVSQASSSEDCLDQAKRAVLLLEPRALESELERARALVGVEPALEAVVVPLLEFMGSEWDRGNLRIAQEHVASAAIRAFLDRTLRSVSTEGQPMMIVATLRGELHELGALMAAIVASLHGWSCLYLGPNAPADEIASAANSRTAHAICLSVINRDNSVAWRADVQTIRRSVDRRCALIVGGRGASELAIASPEVGIYCPVGLGDFKRLIGSLRLASG